jgi:uncharacterized protein YkwD
MRKTLHKYLIPHETNNWKPKFFEYGSLATVLVVAIFIFAGSISINSFIRSTSLGASVYSSVLVDLTNDARKVDNLPILALNDKLTSAAQLKANDMAESGYFAHTSPEGVTPWHWFNEAEYTFVFAGENLAVDFTESEDVENAWLNSPKHRENILDPRFQEIGIAVKPGIYQGHETTFVVQMFGTPITYEETETKTEVTETVKTTPVKKVAITEPENVKGESVEAIKVISETPNTIVVQNQNAAVGDAVKGNKTTNTEVKYATSIDNAIIKTPTYAHYALLALAGIISFALILFICVEIKKQHPRLIFLGLILLVVVIYLAYAVEPYYLVA